jgi:ribosomal protein S27E
MLNTIIILDKDILKIISKYIKCQTQKCKNLGHEQYTFIHTNKGIYCNHCYNNLLDMLYLM